MRTPAWENDWARRIDERLRSRGFDSLSDFVMSKPLAALTELARDLSESVEVATDVTARDVAAVQLLWLLLDDAKSTGAVETLARDLLTRELHERLPQGWPSKDDLPARKRLGSALAAWSSSISSHLPEYRPAAMSVAMTALDERLPVGWIPLRADDPRLVEIFSRHWRDPQ